MIYYRVKQKEAQEVARAKAQKIKRNFEQKQWETLAKTNEKYKRIVEKDFLGLGVKVAKEIASTYHSSEPSIQFCIENNIIPHFTKLVGEPKNGIQEIDYDNDAITRQRYCKLNVPLVLETDINIQCRGKKGQKNNGVLLKELYKECAQKNITDETIVKSWDLFRARRQFILMEKPDGTFDGFFSSQRGDTRNNTIAKAKISRASSALEAMKGTKIFLTLTLDPKITEGGYLEQRKTIMEKLRIFKKKAKKMGLFHITWVAEAHLSGATHIHAIAIFKDKEIKHRKEKSGMLRIASSGINHGIKKLWGIGRVDIQVARPRQVESYLQKYLTKGMSEKNLEALRKAKEINPDERKMLLGILIAVLAKNRMFGCDNTLLKGGEAENEITEIEGASPPAEPGSLISSCNNVLKVCSCKLKIVDNRTLDLVNESANYEPEKYSGWVNQTIWEVAKNLTCSGCICSEIYKMKLKEAQNVEHEGNGILEKRNILENRSGGKSEYTICNGQGKLYSNNGEKHKVEILAEKALCG